MYRFPASVVWNREKRELKAYCACKYGIREKREEEV